MLRPGTVLDNKYVVESVVGRGGFGHIYRARERLTDEIVAIKELTPALVGDPDAVRRFIQEARATLRLTHPHIARTYALFQQGDSYYLAMEFLPGGSLADRLAGAPLPLGDVLRVAADLCAALDYAHRQGVVHCDIKPANVLFDYQGRARRADFGIAHVTGPLLSGGEPTGSGPTFGTLRYMAPEQIDGVRDDPRVDVYALGALLYEMLAGRPYLPFDPDDTPGAHARNVWRIQSQRPRPVREANRAVPDWLAVAIDRALAKNPADRFPSAAALRAALLEATPVAPVTRPLGGPDAGRRSPPTVERPAISSGASRTVPPPPPARPPDRETGFEPSRGAPGTALPRREAPLPRPRPAVAPRRPLPPDNHGVPGWQVAALVGLATLVLILLGAVALAMRFGGGPPPLLPQAGGTGQPATAVAEAQSPTPGEGAESPMPAPAATGTPLPVAPTALPPASRAEQEQALLARVQVRPNGEPVFADRAAQPPAIDGDLGEWGDLRYRVEHVVHQPENWQGAADAGGLFSVAWDDTYLYLAVRVADDAHVNEATGRDLYQGDDVEIQIDANLLGDWDAAGLDDDDAQVGLAVHDLAAGNGEAYVWRPPAREGVPAVQMASRPIDGGYVVEAALPWAAIGLAPRPETPYGFALSLADNDTPGTLAQESMVSTAPGRLWDDPRTWGTLILVNW